MAGSSQGGFKIAGSPSLEQQQDEDGQENLQSNLQEADKDKGVALSPGGNPHGASALIAVEGNSSSTSPVSIPPGGGKDGDAAKDENFWYGNECPVVEEPLD